MNIEERLYEVFLARLDMLEDQIDASISPRWRSLKRLQEAWSGVLYGIPGLKTMGKITDLVVKPSEDEVRFQNPLKIGDSESLISLPVEVAMKIVALGFVPSESES